MKKIMKGVLTVALIGAVQFAWAQEEVSSVNIVGFYKVETQPGGKYNFLALQFDAIDPANANMAGVFGTNNLRKGAAPQFADRVYLWDTSNSTWKAYFQKDDGRFYDASTLAVVDPSPAMSAGDAFLILSPRVGPLAGVTNVMTFAGEVVSVETVRTDVISGIYQPIAFPFSSATTLSNTTLRVQGTQGNFAGQADRVYILDPTTGQYKGYWLSNKNGGEWHNAATDPSGTGPALEVPIELGQGFFYQAKTTFPGGWNQPTPYPDLFTNP